MIKAGIVGGTGYTGIELLRLLHNHKKVEVTVISSRSLNGKTVASIFPSIAGLSDLIFSLPDDEKLFECDVIFFATPHGVAMKSVGKFIEKGIKVIDLGADFRLSDKDEYQTWYSLEHSESALLKSAVYGLCETSRDKIKTANLIANPGCYPTAVQLALNPLLKNNLIKVDNIIADCKSGASGAGRGANQAMLLCEASESFRAYNVSGHRHFPEIKEQLEIIAGQKIELTFVTHLVPMIRGIFATIYVDLLDKDIDVRSYFDKEYQNDKFVKILPNGMLPETRSVKSSNFCQIAWQKVGGNKLVIMSVIDNLVKGASGQAVQNMNIIFGFDESLGLENIGLLP